MPRYFSHFIPTHVDEQAGEKISHFAKDVFQELERRFEGIVYIICVNAPLPGDFEQTAQRIGKQRNAVDLNDIEEELEEGLELVLANEIDQNLLGKVLVLGEGQPQASMP